MPDVVSAAMRALRARRRAHRARPVILAVGLVVAGALTACTPGAYSIDIFREMHYQESQRLQEPNRLAPPPGAIPITGRSPAVTWDQASSLQSPVSSSAQSREQARKLFDVNCAACHGKTANGQSEVATRFSAAGAIPPPDFRSPRVTGRTDGQLYWLVTNGIGNMPAFGDLLTDEQRWMVVQVIRNPQVQ